MRSVALVGLVALLGVVAPAAPTTAAPCWSAPVPGPVVEPFRPPACRWCAGNRGLEYLVARGTVVRAVAAGTVTYSGSIAGVAYVVVRHADGRLVTYGRLTERLVRRGDTVVARTRVGRAAGRFYFGVRLHGRYVDPAPLIGRLLGRPRLVPTDGSAARPGGSATVRCGAGHADEHPTTQRRNTSIRPIALQLG